MNIRTKILLLAVGLSFASCKDNKIDNKKGDELVVAPTKDIIQELKDENAIELKKENGSRADQIKKWNTSANSILKFRTDKSNKSWAILDVGVWEYKFTFEHGVMSKAGEKDGNWIDFNQDLTFEYGYFDQVQGSGKFHYDLDSGLLLMVDNDETKAPHEYKLKTVNDVCIFQGMPTYGDGGQQAKLEKVMTRPKK